MSVLHVRCSYHKILMTIIYILM